MNRFFQMAVTQVFVKNQVQGLNARIFRGILTPALSAISWQRVRPERAFGHLTLSFSRTRVHLDPGLSIPG
jgi:hypothetical protein